MAEPARRGWLRWMRHAQRQTLVTGVDPITRASEVRDLIGELELSATTTYRELAEELFRLRGRPIKLQPYPDDLVAESRRLDEPLPYGVWVPRSAADYVFYRPDTTVTHQRHIILHELGHICCRHVGDEQPPADTSGSPGHAAIATAVKRAGGFAQEQELAAETFAYLVEQRTRPNLSATGESPVDRYRLLED